MRQYFRIAGSSRYLPATRVSSVELDQQFGVPEGTTWARTGVRVRHRAVAPESAATMAVRVTRAALAEAGCGLRDLDYLVDASLSVQQPIPCNAALIQEALGEEAAGIPCLDVHASCLGFVAALNVVNGLFAAGGARRILVVCAETPLRGVNWDEPESACLMGDAAAAFVFEAVPAREGWSFAMQTFAEGAHLCEVAGGGHKRPSFDYTPEQRAAYQFHMDGRAVHKLASRHLPAMVEGVLREAGCTLADLDVVPHQASGPALELMARRLGIARERLHATLAEHGNLVAASVPYVLDGMRRTRPAGARVLLLGTAAGYTQAAALFTL